MKPDVIVVFGDDQLECFDFNNFPSFAVYVGEEFEGHTSSRDAELRPRRRVTDAAGERAVASARTPGDGSRATRSSASACSPA